MCVSPWLRIKFKSVSVMYCVFVSFDGELICCFASFVCRCSVCVHVVRVVFCWCCVLVVTHLQCLSMPRVFTCDWSTRFKLLSLWVFSLICICICAALELTSITEWAVCNVLQWRLHSPSVPVAGIQNAPVSKFLVFVVVFPLSIP